MERVFDGTGHELGGWIEQHGFGGLVRVYYDTFDFVVGTAGEVHLDSGDPYWQFRDIGGRVLGTERKVHLASGKTCTHFLDNYRRRIDRPGLYPNPVVLDGVGDCPC